ncbi:bifunctional riboflavin kinase/FAD synthetase [bacterium]|nr:bifunctional riboflavin kinase/FAD synthetase [bacterium]
MHLYQTIEDIPFFENTVITIGTFDGIHLGHQEIIRDLLSVSEHRKARHLLVTFNPHPLTVVNKEKTPVLLLTTNQEKKYFFQKSHLDNVLFLPFTLGMAKLSASEFIQTVLMKKIGLKGLLIGFNHSLGHDRTGTPEALKEIGERLGFFIQCIDPVKMNDQIVSSTGIRQMLLYGDLESANAWLGRPYSVQGNVISGKKLGRQLGFPTANLDVPKDKLLPKDGVYAVLIHYESEIFMGLANIGYAPTIPGKAHGLEIYIDNFKEIIYNKDLEIRFIKRLRDEEKFESSETMVQQIENDLQKARAVLASYIRR